MILVIDNYDSFTYNLVQYIGEVTDCVHPIEVHRNDELSVRDISQLAPSHLVISPGPCTPDQAGVSVDAVRELAHRIPILGVCLGHQSIAQAFGAKVVRAAKVVHGKTSVINHNASSIFGGIEQDFSATRYHSLVIAPESINSELEVLAWSKPRAEEPSEIMAIRHTQYRHVVGLQFHPESILTTVGKDLLRNFLTLTTTVTME